MPTAAAKKRNKTQCPAAVQLTIGEYLWDAEGSANTTHENEGATSTANYHNHRTTTNNSPLGNHRQPWEATCYDKTSKTSDESQAYRYWEKVI